MRARQSLTAFFILLLYSHTAEALRAADEIRPGEVWRDDRGKPIQAHGGGVIRDGDSWYWFGQDHGPGNPPESRRVACYASQDLMHWTFRHTVLQLETPEDLQPGSAWLERPKVYHNPVTGKYVMYFHLEGKVHPEDLNYTLARVGVAICDRIDGDYQYVRSFRPWGKESRDIGQFIDDDGSAYLIFEARRSKGFYIAQLSQDYLDLDKVVGFVHVPLEGNALVHYQGLYYVVGSHLTHWRPNPNVYASSPKLEGPWPNSLEFADLVPKDKSKDTYGSQSTMLLKITGAKQTTVIFMADMWKPRAMGDSRYLWMPLEIGHEQMKLPEPHPWSIDVGTGEVAVQD